MGLNIKGIFKGAFPFISTALTAGGPLGTMASAAIGKALGVEKVDDPEQAIAGATPEQLLALKNAEQEFAARMAELGFNTVEKLEEIAAADRNSARQREIAVRDKTPMILAFIVVGMVISIEGFIIWHGLGMMDATTAAIVGRILGTLETGLVMVLAYYFGSSSGSADKTAILARVQEDK